MPINPRVFFRKVHRWGAVLIAVPFLLVVLSGFLLQIKKQVPWVQPPTLRGKGTFPTVSMEKILAATISVPEAEVSSWDGVERLDLRLRDGIVKVQCKNRYEVQVDFQTGEVVQVAYRRSDFIETLHDGSWFGDTVKLYVFLPMAVIVFALWATGIYLFVLPYAVKWRRKPRNLQPSTLPEKRP
jgi:uncharacterized iron-regulated membrane protein